ncbi:MAG: YybH family protein [Rhodothermales bacterium]
MVNVMHDERRAVSRVFKGAWLLLLACGWLGCRPAVSPEDTDVAAAEDAVRAVLQQQVEAWNRGDIPAFMDGYVKTDSLRFASGGAVQRGWQATLDRYHRSYPDRAAMGTLAFELHEVRILSPRWAIVFGAYRLERADDRPSGLFTLLFEKRPEGWRIVHDHTSSES